MNDKDTLIENVLQYFPHEGMYNLGRAQIMHITDIECLKELDKALSFITSFDQFIIHLYNDKITYFIFIDSFEIEIKNTFRFHCLNDDLIRFDILKNAINKILFMDKVGDSIL